MATKLIVEDGKACWIYDMVWFLFQRLPKGQQESFWEAFGTDENPPMMGTLVRMVS